MSVVKKIISIDLPEHGERKNEMCEQYWGAAKHFILYLTFMIIFGAALTTVQTTILIPVYITMKRKLQKM